jgi:hypothetical protein
MEEAKGMIKNEMPFEKPLQKLIILIPDERAGMIKDEMDPFGASLVTSSQSRQSAIAFRMQICRDRYPPRGPIFPVLSAKG